MSIGAFDRFEIRKLVTAAVSPGETCVVALPSWTTVRLTLRSTVKVSLALSEGCVTPPTL